MLRAGDDGMPPTMLKAIGLTPNPAPAPPPPAPPVSVRFPPLGRRQLAPEANRASDRGRPVHDVVPPEPQHEPTRSREARVAVGIAPAIEQPVVKLGAVDFDDEPCAAEEEVDAPDPTVIVSQIDLTLRLRQPVRPRQLDETSLELTLRWDVVLGTFLEQRPEEHRASPSMLGQVVEHPTERRTCDQLARQRRVQSSLGSRRMYVAAQVEERPRHRRTRNPACDVHVVFR